MPAISLDDRTTHIPAPAGRDRKTITGETRLRLYVDKMGKIVKVTILSGGNNGLDTYAKEYVRHHVKLRSSPGKPSQIDFVYSWDER
jgi:hypothetical protein